MTKLADLGVASKENKGQFLSYTHIDNGAQKKMVSGVRVRSYPAGPDHGLPVIDPG